MDWVAEIWVDPQWHAVSGSRRGHPAPGLPRVVPLHAGSQELGGTGVSLAGDGDTWTATGEGRSIHVGVVGGPLPDNPVPDGTRVPVGIGSRIYAGEWTRVTIRPALPSGGGQEAEHDMARRDHDTGGKAAPASHSGGHSLVGATGVVHTRIREGGRAGEVRIVVDGLPHYYLAFAAVALDADTPVVVTHNRGGRAVDVEPLPRPGELPSEEDRS